jgi:hypothetical protein
MSVPYSAGAKSLHEQAIEAIIKATNCAMQGDHQQTKMYIQTAKMFSDLTARRMKMMGLHRQAEEYLKALGDHINRVWSIAQLRSQDMPDKDEKVNKARHTVFKIRKNETVSSCKCMKSECTCKCATMEKAACQCSFLQKGFLNPYVGESPARREYMQTGSVKPTWEVGQVKGNPKHAYKMMHELSGEQQKQVQQKFPGEHSRYAYPVHRDTGELVHGQRIPLPPGYAIRAHAEAFKELKPEHKRGAFVQIHAPGHASHGKKGIVHGPNPNVPGKVKVQIGHTENHSIYVEPHQVKLSKAVTRMEKALQTIYNVRKAFMKDMAKNDTAESTPDQIAGSQQNTNAGSADRNNS